MSEAINFPHLGIYLDHVGKSFSVFGIEIAYYGVTIAVAMLAGMILTGCSSSEEIPGGTPDNGPKLRIETRSADAAEAAYAHRAILVSEGNIADAKSAADAAALGSFSVEPGSYTVYAVASSDETNLTFTGVAASNAVADARVKITDIGSDSRTVGR